MRAHKPCSISACLHLYLVDFWCGPHTAFPAGTDSAPSYQTWGQNDHPSVAWCICTLLDPASHSPRGAGSLGKSRPSSLVQHSTAPQPSRCSPWLWEQLSNGQRAQQHSQHKFLLSLAVNFVVGLNQARRRFSDSITPLLRWHPSLRQIPGKQADAVAGLSLRQGASSPQCSQQSVCESLAHGCAPLPQLACLQLGDVSTWSLTQLQKCAFVCRVPPVLASNHSHAKLL